jgi:ferredoxin
MITVYFYINDIIIETQGFLGETVMCLAKRYNIKQIRGICGGVLSCASCHLLIENIHNMHGLEDKTEEEINMLYTLAEPFPLPNSRLSCQIILTKNLNNLKVRIV